MRRRDALAGVLLLAGCEGARRGPDGSACVDRTRAPDGGARCALPACLAELLGACAPAGACRITPERASSDDAVWDACWDSRVRIHEHLGAARRRVEAWAPSGDFCFTATETFATRSVAFTGALGDPIAVVERAACDLVATCADGTRGTVPAACLAFPLAGALDWGCAPAPTCTP